MQCRAGLPHRLAKLSSILCLTPNLTQCANPELDQKYKMEFIKDVVDPLYPFGPLSTPSLDERSDDKVLSKEVVAPRIPPVLSAWMPVGTTLGPLSTPSLNEHNKKDLPQNEVNFESLSLSEPEYKKDSQNVNKFKRISQSKMSMTEALSGVLNVMIRRLSDLVYPGSSSISPRSVNKTMTTGALPRFKKAVSVERVHLYTDSSLTKNSKRL